MFSPGVNRPFRVLLAAKLDIAHFLSPLTDLFFFHLEFQMTRRRDLSEEFPSPVLMCPFQRDNREIHVRILLYAECRLEVALEQ